MLYPSQVRQARATLNISRVELASEAGVSLKTIQRLEEQNNEGDIKTTVAVINKIKSYFTSRGIKFLFSRDEDSELEGIGLRYYPSKDTRISK